jgi:hypothetical protein
VNATSSKRVRLFKHRSEPAENNGLARGSEPLALAVRYVRVEDFITTAGKFARRWNVTDTPLGRCAVRLHK